MSVSPPAGQPFEPAFCRRSGCLANTASPFCAGCGADIAGYLQATTATQPALAADTHGHATDPLWSGPADRRQTPLTAGTVRRVPATPAVTAEDRVAAAVAPPSSRRAWREPVVVAAFTLSCAIGAVGAVAAGLV